MKQNPQSEQTKTNRIALIHATPIAMQPVSEAFRTHWPDAEVTNLLDDSLSPDLEREGKLSHSMMKRFQELADYVIGNGTKAILFTCSAFGPAIDSVKKKHHTITVLKPNEAMFEAAMKAGNRIGMLATYEHSIEFMEKEFYQIAKEENRKADIKTILVENAMKALLAGDAEMHNDLIAASAGELRDCDAIMLAHFSTAKAKSKVSQNLNCPVLTSPESAVRKLKSTLSAESKSQTIG